MPSSAKVLGLPIVTRPLPFEPGSSPFLMKGNAYRGAFDYLAERLPGGLQALPSAFDDRKLGRFFDQPFLAATWYDNFPIVPLVELAAHVGGISFEEFIRQNTKQQLQADLSGIYRMLLKVTSPAALASRLPRLTSQYFNWGGVENVEEVAPGHMRMERTRVPTELTRWYSTAACSYCEGALETAGAKDVKVEVTKQSPDDTVEGVSTKRLHFEFRWRD